MLRASVSLCPAKKTTVKTMGYVPKKELNSSANVRLVQMATIVEISFRK